LARRRPPPATAPPIAAAPRAPTAEAVEGAHPVGFWTRPRVTLAVVLLLATHAGLAVDSLLRENATVDEIAHLPAGVTYWQKGTFKLYHHNPPLVKLIAALPVVLSGPVTAPIYEMNSWLRESHSTFGETFAYYNIANYLEFFDRARLLMPLFTVVGGLVVFAWSSRLYGPGGGLVSLTLWTLCPNVLAHGRLVTGDAAATSIGVGATYLFWRFQRRPTWNRAALAGLALGLAQLTKFSMILLYGLWPALALARLVLERGRGGRGRGAARAVGQWVLIGVLGVVVIDLGYGFEGVGRPLGSFEFASRSLTRPVPPGMIRPTSENRLLESAWRFRVNRFRGTALASLPVPLPRHYLLGFDEQKIETEGMPAYFFDPSLPRDESSQMGYPVYLDGVLRRSGWWYYYLATLAYKVPEGTWLLVGLSAVVLVASRRSRASTWDEVAVLAIPIGVFGAMSFLTDICLGLRYILPIFPYVFIAAGKLGPWISGLTGTRRRIGLAVVLGSLGFNAASVAAIHPHYLSYFNLASGGPDRGAEHLIDSNLDWGQDLVTLRRWLAANHPGRKVGLAYFGQINPSLLALRGDGFEWFLPPPRPDTLRPVGTDPSRLVGPARRLTPGLYAISASIVRGLPWRLSDPQSLRSPQAAWQAAWNADADAFSYFAALTPIKKVGHSIYVYELTAEDCVRLAPQRVRPRL